MRYLESMQTVRAEIPAELVRAAGLDAENVSVKASRLLALELYWEDKVSLGRAAELCHTPLRHGVPLHYDDLRTQHVGTADHARHHSMNSRAYGRVRNPA